MDKKLFTPGPLCTSPTVKSAMLRDLGSRDVEFINLVKSLRKKLVDIAGKYVKVIIHRLFLDHDINLFSIFRQH